VFLSKYHLKLIQDVILYHLFFFILYFILVVKISYHFLSNLHSTSKYIIRAYFHIFPIHIDIQIMPWEHYFTCVPIYRAPLQIMPWELYITCVPIYRAPQIRSWHHPLSSVLIHIVLQIGRESFLSHTFQST
jgi:hypothetical protein